MKEVVDKLINYKKTISTMESCTGGYISNEITNIDGSSEVFKYGAVTYSNEYKIKMGVSKDIIDKYSVYSIETAKEMSRAISEYTLSNYGVGVTGQLKRIDPFNESIDNNIVYISIYDRENDKYYTDSFIVNEELRIDNKEYVYKKIKEKLLEIIE